MLALALVVLLGADEALPPPPLLPAPPGPEVEPPMLLPPPPEPVSPAIAVPATPTDLEEDGPEDDPDAVSFSPARVAVTGAVAGATGAVLVGGALLLAFNVKGAGTATVFLGVLSLPASLFVGTGLAYLVHRGLGGKGGYGAHLGGGAIGGAAVLLATILIAPTLFSSSNPTPAALAGGVTIAAVLFGAGTGLWAERSNAGALRELRERRAAVSLVPIPGGAMASAGFAF